MFWPHEGPDPFKGDLSIVHDTFPKLFRQRIGPLEPSFFEPRFFRFLGVISDSPDDTGHLGDFVYAASEPHGDDLFYGPGFSRPPRPGEKEVVSDPYGDEKEGGGKTLGYVERFPWFVCERELTGITLGRHLGGGRPASRSAGEYPQYIYRCPDSWQRAHTSKAQGDDISAPTIARWDSVFTYLGNGCGEDYKLSRKVDL